MDSDIRANRLAAYIYACEAIGPTQLQWANIMRMAMAYLEKFDQVTFAGTHDPD